MELGAGKLSKQLSQDLLHKDQHSQVQVKVVSNLYGCLNLTLVRANAQSLLLSGGYIIQEGDTCSSFRNITLCFIYSCISLNVLSVL